ncbi:hypothetical protein GP486_005753 [Trichoglossum hirsutum]|uniref:NB-ARC domain-containing protein n=1 Tax=Trichoglossum hirsutum TaxID=265104 RepID=A0A9P8L8L4_9PEZI|nr:hypothetical protein GP486_005753 [Trichoglossum hirsutum]
MSAILAACRSQDIGVLLIPTKATQISFTEYAFLQDENQLLFKQNDEAKRCKSTESTVVGKAKVMSYEDIEEARGKRAAREAAKEAAETRGKRDRKRKSPAPVKVSRAEALEVRARVVGTMCIVASYGRRIHRRTRAKTRPNAFREPSVQPLPGLLSPSTMLMNDKREPVRHGVCARLALRVEMAQPLLALHSQSRTPKDYAIGVICALAVENAAFKAMLDDVHDHLPTVKGDENRYTFGRIGVHNVVVACLPAGMTGNNSAATVAKDMLRSFPIKIGLMVGVGGGVWSKKVDMRLGDVLVSQPDGKHGGVVQWDSGKMEKGGIFKRTGSLDKPPRVLLNALQDVKAKHMTEGDSLAEHLSRMVANKPFMARTFEHQGDEHDQLYQAAYDHLGGETCEECDPGQIVERLPPRTSSAPKIYYGNIASGNEVMKHGLTRDRIAAEEGIICFEMEAAGLMDSFPCLVIRGVYNYADSHKNKRWQPYAAATAAAYAKELLSVIPLADVVKTETADETTREQMCSFYLPFLRNLQFIGRSAELETLKQKLLVKKDCQKVAISGLGGIGKTQVALQFAYSVKEDYPEFSIFWVQALSMETFEQGCIEIARSIGIHHGQESKDDVKTLVRRHLRSKTAGKWLLIIDNADDLDLLCGFKQTEGLLAFLPESDDGLTIFTTRHAGVAQYLVGSDVIKIEKMKEQETVKLLERAGSPPVSYYPGGSIYQQQDAIAIMTTDFGDKTRYQNLANAVAKTWTITFNKILEHDILAADLLAFISCIEWKAIPLVHLATRIWISQNAREVETSMAALKHLSEVFPSGDYRNREIWRDYLPHVARIDKDENCQDVKEKSELCLKVGRCLYVDGRMKEMVLWLQEYCEWRDRNLSQDDADRLLSQHMLAIAYQANGQVKEAVKLLERVVAIRTEVLAEGVVVMPPG